VSNHNVHTGTGGLDASVMWETEVTDSTGGAAFNATLEFILGHHTVRSSMADLLALSTYTAVLACGGPAIPFRIGRVDATGPNPVGAPRPEQDLATFKSQFATAGFNTTDMIKLVACGHSQYLALTRFIWLTGKPDFVFKLLVVFTGWTFQTLLVTTAARTSFISIPHSMRSIQRSSPNTLTARPPIP